MGLGACKNIEYVPVESVRIDTTYISKIKIDSIYERDSIHILDKGDTIYINKIIYKYRTKMAYDTIWHERTDTIQVINEVPAQFTIAQKIRMRLGDCMIGLILGLGGFYMARLLARR